jgi:hypothetical protein
MTGLTPGNLITHLRKLEDAQYVQMEKTGSGVNTLTAVALTHDGRAALARYTAALRQLLNTAEAAHLIVNGPPVIRHSEEIRREGLNLASLAVIGLRMFDRVREAPFPRLRRLLDAIGDAPERFANGSWRFAIDGPEASPRLLGELPLAAGTPPNPAEEDPSIITPSS